MYFFGGNFNPSLSNDVWIVNVKEKIGEWKKINFKNDVGPSPRLYHTSLICNYGKNNGVLLIFGGRDSNENPLNDIWGLSLNDDGSWSWNRGIIKNNDEMTSRYNHSMVFYQELMIIIGGRGHHSNNGPLPTEVYNTETCELFKFAGISMNRQASFIYQTNIFIWRIQFKNTQSIYRKSFKNIFRKNFCKKSFVCKVKFKYKKRYK